MVLQILHGRHITELASRLVSEEGLSTSDAAQVVADADAVFSRCQRLGAVGSTRGLIYGDIQSGKTAVMLALIAIAADNGYSRFVLLTSDLNDLYEQTLSRSRSALQGFGVYGKAEMRQTAPEASAWPYMLVVSKNVNVLRRAVTISQAWAAETVMIVDDEADQASLDTKINDPQPSPHGVNAQIQALRTVCSRHAFVQTTATPQALLLQDANNAFRPEFVHVTTPGTGYCGGDVFFIREDFRRPKYLRFVPLLDVVALRTSRVLPDSMVAAIVTFFVAATVLRLGGSTRNYQALIHTSLRRAEHDMVKALIDDLARDITVQAILARELGQTRADQKIMAGLQSALDDLSSQVSLSIPTFAEVLGELAASMPSTSIIQINSNTGQGVQVAPDRRHVIYVGGTKLGRGVTIHNLLVTCYARDAKNPQVDTVLQHARMYGYRSKELPFTRIFLPEHLAERFRQIHIADNSMRELAGESHAVIPVIPIPIQNLRATRRNVISRQSVELTTFLGGRQYYPLVPVSSGRSLATQTSALDSELATSCPNERQVYSTTIDHLVRLLQHRFGDQDAPGAWDDELIQLAVSLQSKDERFGNQANLIVGSRSSAVSKLATRSSIPQIQALLPANAGNPPYGARRDVPVLVFMRLVGATRQGWDGVPFWVPNIRFPDGNYAFSLNRT